MGLTVRNAIIEVGIQNASRIRKTRYPLCGPDKTERLYPCVVTVTMIDAIVVPLFGSTVGPCYRKPSLAATPALSAYFRLIEFSKSIATLINNTHIGNTRGIHRIIPMLNKSTAPKP